MNDEQTPEEAQLYLFSSWLTSLALPAHTKAAVWGQDRMGGDIHLGKCWMRGKVTAATRIWQNGKWPRYNSLECMARFRWLFSGAEVRELLSSQSTHQGQSVHVWQFIVILRTSTSLCLLFESHFLSSWGSVWLEQRVEGGCVDRWCLEGRRTTMVKKEKALAIL